MWLLPVIGHRCGMHFSPYCLLTKSLTQKEFKADQKLGSPGWNIKKCIILGHKKTSAIHNGRSCSLHTPSQIIARHHWILSENCTPAQKRFWSGVSLPLHYSLLYGCRAKPAWSFFDVYHRCGQNRRTIIWAGILRTVSAQDKTMTGKT